MHDERTDERIQVIENLLDEQAARMDDMERRFEKLVDILRNDDVCKALGLRPLEFDRTVPTCLPMRVQTTKHEVARLRAADDLRRKAVVDRLAQVPAGRLDELLRGR